MNLIKGKDVLAEDNNKNISNSSPTQSNKFLSFITRLISGLFLIVITFVVLYKGGNLLFLTCALLSICALVELYRVFELANSRIAIIGYMFTIFYYLILSKYESRTAILLYLIVILLLFLTFYVFSYPKFNIKQISMIIFSLIYISITFSFIYLIREKNDYGKYLVWMIFICSWGCDTFAYCFGMLFGKHKLSPILSPNKTIEGAIGGIIGASTLGIIYIYIIFNKLIIENPFSLVRVGVACGVGAIISMLGDLTASAIKRDYNAKDFGNLIPGHGGILDRFDSVIFAAPALYFILTI